MRPVEGHELNDPAFWRAMLGEKVSMRLRNPGDAAHPFTEAVGVVRSVEMLPSGRAVISVVTRRGEVRAAPVADVLVAKVF